MAKSPIEKTLSRIESTEDSIQKILTKQSNLDKKLLKAIETQNKINSEILKQLSEMQDFSLDESTQQHKRFKIELGMAIPSTICGAIAALASAVSVYLMLA